MGTGDHKRTSAHPMAAVSGQGRTTDSRPGSPTLDRSSDRGGFATLADQQGESVSKGKPKSVRNETAIDRKDNANTAKQQANKAELVEKMKGKIQGK